jgi:alkaline phosphatase D
VLWTRLTTQATLLPITGRWEVATDEAFGSIVASGPFSTDADRDFTVKVDATGLNAATTYHYRFITGANTSPVGRTKTAPTDAKQLRFAVVSCASLPHGYFHAYAAIAERDDIDAVIHLGDYIYEYGDGEYGSVRPSEPTNALETLADYRTRYAQYRQDHDLQEAHRLHPFICTWDDHELIDNAWRGGTTGDNPHVGAWDERKRVAALAYMEWIPIREQPDGRVWRDLSYGTLADLLVLDTRVWGRDKQVDEQDPVRSDPARQLLGADQERWLSDRLVGTKARWKLVCQQVMMTETPSVYKDDSWDGYPAARSRFFDILERSSIADVVVLSGDIHSSWACDLTRTEGSTPLAVELVTPAITSPGPDVDFGTNANPRVKYSDLTQHGYVLVDLDEKRAEASWIHVSNVESEQRGQPNIAAKFTTTSGQNRLVREP